MFFFQAQRAKNRAAGEKIKLENSKAVTEFSFVQSLFCPTTTKYILIVTNTY